MCIFDHMMDLKASFVGNIQISQLVLLILGLHGPFKNFCRSQKYVSSTLIGWKLWPIKIKHLV